MSRLRYILFLIPLVLLFILPTNSFARERAFEDHPWNVNVGMGVGLYRIIPMPDLELSMSYRVHDFYHLGLQFNIIYLHFYGSIVSRRFQYQALVINTFDFYRGKKATWSAKIGLGYMNLFYRRFVVGERSDDEPFDVLDRVYIHSFSTLISIVLDYRLTDLFSLGFSMPLTINFNKYHEYWGGFNLLFNMGFHF